MSATTLSIGSHAVEFSTHVKAICCLHESPVRTKRGLFDTPTLFFVMVLVKSTQIHGERRIHHSDQRHLAMDRISRVDSAVPHGFNSRRVQRRAWEVVHSIPASRMCAHTRCGFSIFSKGANTSAPILSRTAVGAGTPRALPPLAISANKDRHAFGGTTAVCLEESVAAYDRKCSEEGKTGRKMCETLRMIVHTCVHARWCGTLRCLREPSLSVTSPHTRQVRQSTHVATTPGSGATPVGPGRCGIVPLGSSSTLRENAAALRHGLLPFNDVRLMSGRAPPPMNNIYGGVHTSWSSCRSGVHADNTSSSPSQSSASWDGFLFSEYNAVHLRVSLYACGAANASGAVRD